MANTKKSEKVALDIALREARDWCETALFQGGRLTELLDNQVAFLDTSAMPAELRALRAANVLPGGARVEVVECFFFLAAVRRVLVWLGHLTRHGNRPPKDLVLAVKAFVASVPRAAHLRRTLEQGYAIRRRDLVDFNDLSDGGAAFRAARGSEYVMAGGVNLPATMAALRKLGPVLAATPQ
jgi:hypothetical protein